MSRPGRVALMTLSVGMLAFVLGAWVGPKLMNWARAPAAPPPFDWPAEFSVVDIPSSVDGKVQKAYFLPARPGGRKPLLVSLHVWSGSYASRDPLAFKAKEHGWNYIHPDFRGPNETTENCLSDKVIADIDEAISFALKNGHVDQENVFVVGFSGGGYAVLGAYARSRHRVRLWQAWAPISDLEVWYWQTKARRHDELSNSILRCTGNAQDLNVKAAQARSPLFWPLPDRPPGRMEIFAGLADGHVGTVPISHSIAFFNRLAEGYGESAGVSPDEVMRLLTRGLPPPGERLGSRLVFLSRETGFASLTVFDGGHEMDNEQAFERLKRISGQ